jgi:tetrahydromethanopterin S-methyltransferase subunit A
VISEKVEACAQGAPGPFAGAPTEIPVQSVQAAEPQHLALDKAGYFVVYPDKTTHRLALEHYVNAGVLGCVIEGHTATSLYTEAINRNLVSRLDRAAYLGRELTRAEMSLKTGQRYIQDREPGEAVSSPAAPSCGCTSLCG